MNLLSNITVFEITHDLAAVHSEIPGLVLGHTSLCSSCYPWEWREFSRFSFQYP